MIGNPPNRQVRVKSRASGIPTAQNFAVVEAATPACGDGEVLIEILFVAVDPAMRGWISAEANYFVVADGDVMPSHGVARIIDSRCDGWSPGELAFGWFAWQRYMAVGASALHWKVDPAIAPPSAWLSVLGLNGLTAWLGFHHLAHARAGETILVSTAAGGVGSVVGQLAAAHGVRAVGLTSSTDKIAIATTLFGYDAAIDYRAASDLEADIAKACPSGADIFFDNTGGAIADAAFPALNVGGRIIQCGTASVTSWLPPPSGPRRDRDMLVKRLSWHGLLFSDHVVLFPRALAELQALYCAGQLVTRHEILDGLDAAPDAIGRLYRGENQGRLMIRVT